MSKSLFQLSDPVVAAGEVYQNEFEVKVKAVGAGETKKPVHAAFGSADARLHVGRSTKDVLDTSAKHLRAANVPYNEAGIRFHQVGGLYLATVRAAG